MIATKTQIESIELMTDENDHFGARILISRMMLDKKLEEVYSSLEMMHREYSGLVGNNAITTRNSFEDYLIMQIKAKISNAEKVIESL